MQGCMIPSCRKAGVAYLGVRLRHSPQGDADWAPNTHTFLCREHAQMGGCMTIMYEPQRTGVIETRVYAVATPPVKRRLKIGEKRAAA